PYAKYFLLTLSEISLFWAILNLLPILPLDGGRLLETILGPGNINVTLWISIIVAVGVGICAFAATGQPILPIFLGMFAYQAFQALKQD
ncbi:MAG: site-2 protease family protein, partial [Armatimonadetes bacterium]|nr:site-2 protease family protein [Akkermansiaceae bacterium]